MGVATFGANREQPHLKSKKQVNCDVIHATPLQHFASAVWLPFTFAIECFIEQTRKGQISEANYPKIIEMNYLVNWIKDGDGDRDFDKELLGLSELASWISVHPELQAISIEKHPQQ